MFLVNDTLSVYGELIGRANSRDAVQHDRGGIINVEDPMLTGVVG